MTDTEITALAREYAEEEAKGTAVDTLPNGLKENVIQLNADHFEKHLRFLLSRYCLVEKSEVEVHLRSARQLEKDAAALKIKQLGHVGRTRCELIKALFPDMVLKDEAAAPEEE